MLNNTNISNLILSTNVFAADLWWSSSTILISKNDFRSINNCASLLFLSRNHLPHQLNQPPTPAHNHQSTNHEHLQSLTTTIQKLTHLSHSSAGLKVPRFSMLVDAYLSARPSWNSSLPVDTQVYIQLELFILLPVHPSLSLLCWKPSLGYIE